MSDRACTPNQKDAGYLEFACGCPIEMQPGDPPVQSFECEHGNSIRAVGPPTGEEIRQYQAWVWSGDGLRWPAGETTTIDFSTKTPGLLMSNRAGKK